MEGPPPEGPSLDIWGFFKRRKSFVIVFFVVGAGLGDLLYNQKIPQYRSVARVEVIHRVSDSVLQGLLGKDMLDDALYVIPSPNVLRPAYDSHDLGRLDTLSGLTRDESVSLIAGGLTIAQLSAGVIEIQYTGTHPQDSTRVTNAVANEYIKRQKSSFETETEKLKRLLEIEREKIDQQLHTAEREYDEFKQRARLLANSGDSGQARLRLQAISAEISQIDIDEADLSSQLSVFTGKLEDKGQRGALLVMISKEFGIDEDGSHGDSPDVVHRRQQNDAMIQNNRRMTEALLPLVVESAILEQKVGKGHPRLREVRQRIELVRQQYAKLESIHPALGSVPLGDESGETPDYLVVYRQSLQHELERLRAQRDQLRELEATAENEAFLVDVDEQTEARLLRRIDRFETQYNSIAIKIEQTEINAEVSRVRATVIMPATGGHLVYPILYRFLGFGGLLGAIAGLALGYIVELADRSFRKPDEVVREFGVPIFGHVPYMKSQQARGREQQETGQLDPMLICAHLPRSRPAEAFRSVRTTVCFTATGDCHRVLQITSPAAGDGKSTLAANLAISLAQSGKKTILVESDFRRPNVHKLTGVSNTIGIVDVLRQNAELPDAIQTTDVDEFSVLPCGKRPGNPSELLTRPEYEALLGILREKFDYVVVDTPPVLVVTDASSVAPRVDAVIMCIRLNRHTRDMGRRAFEQMRDIGANVVGMVINGVEQSDTYGYGAYNYSDYRSYANPYAYKYAYKYTYGNEAYFTEEEDPAPVKRLMSTNDGGESPA